MDNKALTAVEVLTKLIGCRKGSQVFVSYLPGREANRKQVSEAPVGMAGRHLVGTLSDVRIARNGDPIITIFAHNRGRSGSFRAINPNLGQVLAIELLT